jgi:hypothetical protein
LAKTILFIFVCVSQIYVFIKAIEVFSSSLCIFSVCLQHSFGIKNSDAYAFKPIMERECITGVGRLIK